MAARTGVPPDEILARWDSRQISELLVYLRSQPSLELMLDHYLAPITALLHAIFRMLCQEPPAPVRAEDLRIALESRAATRQSMTEMMAAFEKAAVHSYD